MIRLAQLRFELVVWDAALPHLPSSVWDGRVAPVDRPPLLFLATCDSLHCLVPGLGLGGEGYVTKPVRIAEVLARAQILMRGRSPEREGVPCYGDLVLDDVTCQARRGPRQLGLTPPSTGS
ncbi:hypothetical protein ACGFZQ_43625 [Streptomyces sp. NPDC048254]|uniref:hypothetical protein n=1 Tax=Streptomyces sp. NPDC048254 TaxID=3365525 RepID=UPI0037234913